MRAETSPDVSLTVYMDIQVHPTLVQDASARSVSESAKLQAVEDPLRIESLNRAGKLLFAVDPGRAPAVLPKAADLALMHGDVARSAHAYLDAAAAIERDPSASPTDRRAANEYVTTAMRLAEIPGLIGAQRSRILRRIDSGTLTMP